jgi:hypothetical protein
MRLWSGVLALIGVGSIALAVADPPSAPAASSTPVAPAANAAPATPAASTAPAAAPATPAAAAAAPATSVTVSAQEESQMERHFRSEGYTVEMHNGQKMYCRKEQVLGSRLGGSSKTCTTEDQLKMNESQAQSDLSRTQHQWAGTSGK